MRVLLINPWAVVNDEYYASGFISGMNNNVDLDFASNFYYGGELPNGKIYRLFFKRSQNMSVSKKRKVIRGIEYIHAWNAILQIVKNNKYDVIHVHWLLMYKLDIVFLKKIKSIVGSNTKLVLTAHNVLPHVEGEKSIADLNQIYNIFDDILVHGETIKDEFSQYFPNCVDKVSVQSHGEYYNQNKSYTFVRSVKYNLIKEKTDAYSKTYIMFGGHFYNKGTDRLLDAWDEVMSDENALLIIMGAVDTNYGELKERISSRDRKNVLFFEGFSEDNFLNYAISQSDCILIPYRHASMSGIVYTAANFEKTTICTRCGAIAEYLVDGVDSFVCENSLDGIERALLMVQNESNETLASMGKQLKKNIHENYNWNRITQRLYTEVYCE